VRPCEYVPLLFLFDKIDMPLIKKDNPILFFFCFINFKPDGSSRPMVDRLPGHGRRFGRVPGRASRPA
jgi:hypothetical protein